MRILWLSTWFPYPLDNGSKIRVRHLLRALGARHSVTLLSFAFGTSKPDDASELGRFLEEIEVVRQCPFDRSRIVKSLRFLSPVPVVALPVCEMKQAVQGVFARNRYDVAIASTETMATYALRAPQGTIRVLEEHNSLTRWMWERYREQDSTMQRLRCWLSWQKTRYYESFLFRRFDLCTMVSEQDREASLRALPGYRGWVEVVPNGVDCEHNQPGLALPRPSHLVFNGALTYHANYDAMKYFLAEIYPLVKNKVPEVSLTITGSTAGVDLSALQLDESVCLSGYVDDIRPLVAGAWVCVVPIRQGGGTRLKILEAMALGTPVVSTSKGAEGLDVTPGEDILLVDNPVEFASQVVRVLQDRALYLQLATHGRQLVERCYDWAEIGWHFVDLVESVVQSRRLT